MSKILFLSNHFITLYSFRKELITELCSLGYDIYISTPDDAQNVFFENLGCKIIPTEINRHGMNPLKDIKLIFKYIKVLKEKKPDIVLSYTIKPDVYGGIACSIMKTPYITNITGLGSGVENGGIIQKIIIELYRVSMKCAYVIFFQNRQNMNYFISKRISKSEKYRLIPGSGVNLQKFNILPYPNEDNMVNFVFISRIMKEKGIDHYFEAAKFIKKKYPNTTFHVCGFFEQDYEKKILDLQQRNIIVYHGMVQDVRSILSISHCIIHPSYHEGMANVILEAAACGRPCLCSDIPGCREAVENGETGFLFQSKNTQSLINVIEKFLTLSNKEMKLMGEKARKKMEQEFDRNIIINSYIKEINNVMEEKK